MKNRLFCCVVIVFMTSTLFGQIGYQQTNNSGTHATALGLKTTASGKYSASLGYFSTASGNTSFALGRYANASGLGSFALGERTDAAGDNSYSVGNFLRTTGNNSVTLGSGVSSSVKLFNSLDNTMMIGVNSNVPTLVVRPLASSAAAGRVGIGTDNPLALLHLKGTANLLENELSLGDPKFLITKGAQADDWGEETAIGVGEISGVSNNYRNFSVLMGGTTLIDGSYTSVLFRVSNMVNQERVINFRVDENDVRVGNELRIMVGGVSPSETCFRLSNSQNFNSNLPEDDVFRINADGHVWATEINVRAASDFPDYVFEKDYSLMTLNDLGEFIKKNKRLPNMPSADSVAQEGMDLGEMNRLLTEKVEELTLYILELENRISKIEQQK